MGTKKELTFEDLEKFVKDVRKKYGKEASSFRLETLVSFDIGENEKACAPEEITILRVAKHEDNERVIIISTGQ